MQTKLDMVESWRMAILLATMWPPLIRAAELDVCTASAALLPTMCPGYSMCDPNAIHVGDDVTVQICIDNNSERFERGSTSSRKVKAMLPTNTGIEVFVACTSSRCDAQFEGVLEFSHFTPDDVVEGIYFVQSATGGTLIMRSDLMIEEHVDRMCLGTIHLRAKRRPSGTSTGLFYILAQTTVEQAVHIVDDRCIEGITGGGSTGSTVARFVLLPPPSAPPQPSPLATPS